MHTDELGDDFLEHITSFGQGALRIPSTEEVRARWGG